MKKLEERGIQITDKNVMIEFADNTCQVNGKITAVEKIGRYQPAEERSTEHESE